MSSSTREEEPGKERERERKRDGERGWDERGGR